MFGHLSGNPVLIFLALFPMAGAIVSYLVGRKNKDLRNYLADAMTILEFAVLAVLFVLKLCGADDLSFAWDGFCGFGLHLTLDGFRALYGTIAALMWMMTTIFSREYFGHYRNRNRYYMFVLLTLGATVGVFLSADLYTTFIFFEIMSFTSYVWVVHEEKPAAMRAGETYLAVAIIGGMVMLMGIFLLYQITGTFYLDELLTASHKAIEAAEADPAAVTTIFGAGKAAVQKQLYLSGALMMFGFGAKAGMFPLHIWLPKAHPVAPAPSSALLSGILTKSGIYGVLAITANIFLYDANWGFVVLVLGTITMFGGALLAVFSVDFKRTLACSSMSQIGFILVGVGTQCLLAEENALAVRGTLLHMVNHSLIKLDLFMVAGVIFMNIHKLNLNEIRGFGRKKPLLMFSYLMGALGIGGIPLWNGYVSKTLLHEGIVEYTELLEEAEELAEGAGHVAEEAAHAAEGAAHAAESAFAGIEGVAEAAGGWMGSLMHSVTFMKTIEWIFLISGGMTIAYMLKLFFAVFIEENEDKAVQKKYDDKKNYWNKQSRFAVVGSACILPVLGFLPYLTMNKLADLGQGFMHGEAPAHAVHYFSLTNLKGACISIAIGLILYFGFIRTVLMVKTADGKRRYVDRWPAWLDLENLIYRPIVQVILPAVCGAGCRVLDVLLDAMTGLGIVIGTFAGRTLDSIVDFIILLARKTTHKQMTTPVPFHEHDSLAVYLGNFLDFLLRVKDPDHSYVKRLAEYEEDNYRTGTIIAGSLAFGLMLVSIGLIITLLYLVQGAY